MFTPAPYVVYVNVQEKNHPPVNLRCGGAATLEKAHELVKSEQAHRKQTYGGLIAPATGKATWTIYRATYETVEQV